MSNKETVTVDGEEYIFPPDQVCKPEKNKEDNIIYESGGKP